MLPGGASRRRPYHPAVIPTAPAIAPRPAPRFGGSRTRSPPLDRSTVAEAIPRPAGARPARERPSRTQRAVDLPDRRSGRGPRVAGRRTGPVRGRASPAWPGSTRTVVVPAGRAAASSAGSSASSATTSGTRSSACRDRAPTTRTCRPLRLALHDWVVAWDRRTGHAWIGGRALDGDARPLGSTPRRRPRPADEPPPARSLRGGAGDIRTLEFRSGPRAAAPTRRGVEAGPRRTSPAATSTRPT